MSKPATGKRRASGSPSEDAPASKRRGDGERARERGSASDKGIAPIFRPPPEPIHVSSSIEDRQSTFVGRIYRITSVKDAEYILANLNNDADHNMAAWRVLSLKPGRTGLAGPDDFRVESASRDDGEQWGGKRILGIMEKEGVSDALVVVSRWYGGVLLGPVRFTHIENCAREVCQFFKSYEEVEELVARLTALDDELAALRAQLAERSARSEEAPISGNNSDDNSNSNSNSTATPAVGGETTSPATAGDASASASAPKPKQPSPLDAVGSSQTAVHASSSPAKPPPSYDRLLKAKPPDVGTAQRLVKAREKAVSSVKALLGRGGAAA